MEYYTSRDFAKVPKIDAHFHYNSRNGRFVEFADSLNFKLVSINVDTEIPIDTQMEMTQSILKQFPGKFAFLGTFTVDKFEQSAFENETIDRIKSCRQKGASGIKIWKNIGMTLQDAKGDYIMADHSKFDPIYSYLEINHIPMVAHLGEPKNCWLPVEEMTTANDKRYYQNHPQYHMYLHPESPSYQDQINARNNVLQKHPDLTFIGAHLASEEWSVEKLAESFERFPNLKADLAARISHLQYQSTKDRDLVRNFLIKYQDRILYGTDMSVNDKDSNTKGICEGMEKTWLNNWIYLATDSVMEVKGMPGVQIEGLQLPKTVVDKIFYQNSKLFFKKN